MNNLNCPKTANPVVTIIPDNPQVVLGPIEQPLKQSPMSGTTSITKHRSNVFEISRSNFLAVPERKRRDVVIPAPADIVSTPNRKQMKSERKSGKKDHKRKRNPGALLYPTPIMYQDVATIPNSYSSPSPKTNAGQLIPMGSSETTEASNIGGFQLSPMMIIFAIGAVILFLFVRK